MSLSQYLAEMKKIRLLSPAEEQNLWQAYKDQGDLDSRRRLIEHYQPLVFKVAMRWRADESAIMDIIQEGTVGLIEAVENYDYTKGVAFSIYAIHRIRGRAINYLMREGNIKYAYIEEPVDSEASALTLGDSLIDVTADTSRQAEHNYLVQQVKMALSRLPVKEQAVLSGVYLENCEPRQLAESMNLSISHIYRLQKQGVRRIRGMLSKLMQHW